MNTILLIDDEPVANVRMRRLLSDYPEFSIIGEVESLAEAKEFLKKTTPGIIFLDMELRGGLGVSILKSLNPSIKVVFVTAYMEYAVEAYDVGAVDYLVKPVDPERLGKTLERIRNLTPNLATPLSSEVDESSDTESELTNGILHLTSKRYGKSEHIPINSIVWIRGAQNYSEVQFNDQKKPVTYRRRLNEWDGILASDGVHRLDRSLIIQLAQLRSTEWINRDQTLLWFVGVEQPLEIGRTASLRLKEILNQESED